MNEPPEKEPSEEEILARVKTHLANLLPGIPVESVTYTVTFDDGTEKSWDIPTVGYPEEIVSVSGSVTNGEYNYIATQRDGRYRRILTSGRKYKWFHQRRCPTASEEPKIIHYFSTKQRAAPVPAYVPGRAERLEPVSIVYV